MAGESVEDKERQRELCRVVDFLPSAQASGLWTNNPTDEVSCRRVPQPLPSSTSSLESGSLTSQETVQNLFCEVSAMVVMKLSASSGQKNKRGTKNLSGATADYRCSSQMALSSAGGWRRAEGVEKSAAVLTGCRIWACNLLLVMRPA